MTDAKSRTLKLTDEEWDEITEAAVRRGFTERGRGKLLVQLAREDNARAKREAARDGYDSGLEQIEKLREDGYNARFDGMAPTRCTWKKGTPEHGFWMEGYDKAKSEEQD